MILARNASAGGARAKRSGIFRVFRRSGSGREKGGRRVPILRPRHAACRTPSARPLNSRFRGDEETSDDADVVRLAILRASLPCYPGPLPPRLRPCAATRENATTRLHSGCRPDRTMWDQFRSVRADKTCHAGLDNFGERGERGNAGACCVTYLGFVPFGISRKPRRCAPSAQPSPPRDGGCVPQRVRAPLLPSLVIYWGGGPVGRRGNRSVRSHGQ